jgi:hypothetical protein
MIRNEKRFLFFALVLMFIFILPIFSEARDITFTPQLFLNGEYNDNILFSRTEKEDDFIFNIAPAIELTYASELFELNSSAIVQFRRHLSEDDLDREDYFLHLRGRYQMTERLRFQGRLNYRQDFTTETRTIDIAEPLLEEIPIDESDIVERGIERFLSERKRYNAFASLNYRLTEVSNLNFGYRYLKTEYDSQENRDFEVNNANLTYMRNLAGQKDQVGTRLSYSQRTSDISDTDSYGIGLIWNHFFTETISIYTDVGLRYTEEDIKDTGLKDDNWNGTADIRLRRRGETNVVDLGFRQNVQTASTGRSVNVSRLYWNASQILSERFVFELFGDFYITREDSDSISDTNTVYFDVIPSLRYLLTENHSLTLSYNYTIHHDRSLEENRDKERNRVWVMLEFGFPYFKVGY